MPTIGYLSGAPRVSTRPTAESGGPRSHILGILAGFRALGWQMETFIVGDSLPPGLVAHSEQMMHANRFSALVADLSRLALRYLYRRAALKKLGQVDWVYERFATFQALGKAFQSFGTAWILETNGTYYAEAKSDRRTMVLSGIARKLELQAYRDCDVLICISNTLKDLVCREAGISESKVIVVPNGVDSEFFSPDNQSPNRVFEGFTIGFVGRIVQWQGLDLLMRAVCQLKQEENMDINLVFVGEGLQRPPWEKLMHEFGLAANVRFLRQVPLDAVPSHIAGFDVGFEGKTLLRSGTMYHSPLKIYEYLAMGKPVIASAFEDSCRVIRDRETGFLFMPGDLRSLKQAIVEAFHSRDKLSTMGRVGRESVKTQHSWNSRVAQMVPEILRILEARSGIVPQETLDLAPATLTSHQKQF